MLYLIKKTILLCLLTIFISSTPDVNAESKAIRITANNASQLVQHGPDAIGGIDDWFITNGVLCAVISDVDHESELSSNGGVLTDLGFCDRADDHLTFIQDLIDGKRSSPMNVNHINFETGDNWVSVLTTAQQNGARVSTRYTLSEESPTQLSISKELSVTDENQADFNLYSAAWFNYHSLETFVFSPTESEKSRGFKNVDIVTRGVSAIREAASNADVVVLLSPPDAIFPISYGWQLKSAERVNKDNRYDLPRYILSDEETTSTLVLTDSFYLGDGSSIGLMQLPQIPFLTLDSQDKILIEEIIYVGDRADVASISDQLVPQGKVISGRSEDVNSAIHIYQGEQPITFVRPDSNGYFEFKLLAGDYQLEHHGSANRLVEYSLQINNADTDLGTLTLPALGELSLPRGHAMRLVFVGLNGTPDPNFEDSLTGYSVVSGDEFFQAPRIRQLFLTGLDSDPLSVGLAAGEYRVYATRGPEYSLTSTDIKITTAKESTLEIELPQHVVDTPDYISADLHVHAGVGFDNTFSTTARVKTFVAEHAEVMVASEHDVPMDFAPIIAAMDLSDKVVSIAAVEMTSQIPSKVNPYTGGHVNFFPVQPQPLEYRKGMINHEERHLREVIAEFNQQHPQAIAQLNHARQNLALSEKLPNNYEELIDYGAYLDHMGEAAYPYNPEQSLHTHPNNSLIEPDPKTNIRNIDFEAMEIINPGGPFHQDRIAALRKDWLSFIRQGFRITGTANSDSHHSGQQVGLPRTMVAMSDDSVTEFNQDEFIQSIVQGNVYGTTGPMLELELTDKTTSAMIGQTFSGNRAQLNVSVLSADWIDVDTVKVQLNGETVLEVDLADKVELNFDLEFTQDSFVTVEVSGPASDEYKIIYPEITPYAFSNPIYVDYDQDGNWAAPGL